MQRKSQEVSIIRVAPVSETLVVLPKFLLKCRRCSDTLLEIHFQHFLSQPQHTISSHLESWHNIISQNKILKPSLSNTSLSLNNTSKTQLSQNITYLFG